MRYVFDINETMLDLADLDAEFGSSDLRRAWFTLVLRTSHVSAATGDYRDFAEIGAAAGHYLGVDDEAMQRVARRMRTLPPHPDVLPGLQRLRDAGHRLVALGNSPRRVLEPQLEHSGIADLLHATYSVEQAGQLKPNLAAYRLVLAAEGVSPQEATMVAAHDWDIAGAAAAGMRTALVVRADQRPLPLQPEPDLRVADLQELAAKA